VVSVEVAEAARPRYGWSCLQCLSARRRRVPIDRKRRIFRPGPLAPPRRTTGLRPTLAAGAAVVLLVGAVVLLWRPAALLGRVPAGAGTLRAAPDAVAVIDGATLRLDAQVVRLHGVTAPARGQVCHYPDGREVDCGAAAAEGLARLVRDRAVECHLQGRDSAGVQEATCLVGESELNRAVIAAGWARAERDAPGFGDAEVEARAAHRGLWAAAAAF
jgi:endonuclease YncB( thermonuclease family)